MNILSIHSAGHDTGVSYFKDGRLIFTIETERLTRSRYDHRSEIALQYCLSRVGDEGIKTDLVVASTPLRNRILSIPDVEKALGAIGHGGRLHYETTCRVLGKPTECLVVLHEASHAALAAHYAAYREHSLILVNEGKGQVSRSSLYTLRGQALRLVQLDPLPWYGTGFGWTALGYLYGFGLGPQVAGKLMAIGGYGTPSAHVRRVFLGISNAVMRDRVLAEQVMAQLRLDQAFRNEFGAMADVIATFQQMFTETVTDLVSSQLPRTQSQQVALGGGCALNLNTNTALRACLSRDVFIAPACNDAGQSLGAGVYAQKFFLGSEAQPFSVFSNGVSEGRHELSAVVKARGLEPIQYDPYIVGRELTQGAVVAFFFGRSEIGPRALGARSILANPSVPGMRQRLSERLKGREWYRPLGATMRLERFKEIFPSEGPSPYMLFSYSPKALLVPEATHVDGSSRIQTLTALDCPRLYELLVEFEKQSGLSALINTSLNARGRAIAYRATDVLDDFLGTDVNLFVFDDFMAFNRPTE